MFLPGQRVKRALYKFQAVYKIDQSRCDASGYSAAQFNARLEETSIPRASNAYQENVQIHF
jgi:hypothetical protein